MKPKRTLTITLGLALLWGWWSVVLDDKRGDEGKAEAAESSAQVARFDVFVPTMTKEEALVITSEAEVALTYFGDPEYPNRAESRSRHVRDALLEFIGNTVSNACAPSISDSGATVGPHISEVIPVSITVTVPDVVVERFITALVEHPLIVMQAIGVGESTVVEGGASTSDGVSCMGIPVHASFDLYGRAEPPGVQSDEALDG